MWLAILSAVVSSGASSIGKGKRERKRKKEREREREREKEKLLTKTLLRECTERESRTEHKPVT